MEGSRERGGRHWQRRRPLRYSRTFHPVAVRAGGCRLIGHPPAQLPAIPSRDPRHALEPVKPDTVEVSPEKAHAEGRRELDPAQRALQGRLLQHVSRTFALTIPRLSPALADVVGNGYLLCRLIDTIEDELPASASSEARAAFYDRFDALLEGRGDANAFAVELGAALRPEAPEGERELVACLPEVLDATARFDAFERAALRRCTSTMAEGMHRFESGAGGSDGECAGLENVASLERYCYHVAGVVGEMLTELFCHHSPAAAERRDTLLALSVPFGNGLQLTNILKDAWDDHRRGVCWLPRDAFGGEATDLHALFAASIEAGGTGTAGTGAADAEASRAALATLDEGFSRLVALCRGYLDEAVRYVLTLPASEHGMRVFCLWSVSMAVLTLRKIHARRAAAGGEGARITRNSVRVSLLLSDLCARNDALLRAVHAAGGVGLPSAARPPTRD